MIRHKISEINRIIIFAENCQKIFLGRGFLPWIGRVTGNDNIILSRLIYLFIPGPFWIATTLVFTTAISGNLANYIQHAGQDYQWRYDFHKGE